MTAKMYQYLPKNGTIITVRNNIKRAPVQMQIK